MTASTLLSFQHNKLSTTSSAQQAQHNKLIGTIWSYYEDFLTCMQA